MNLPRFYHIGFHKTGTTFLQRSIFAKHPGIVLRNSFRFFLEEDLHRKGEEWYGSLFPGDYSGKVVMESSEGLSGGMFTTGHYRAIAERVKSVSPEGKILLLIRNQVGMIESLYKQYVKERGTLQFEGFLRSPTGQGALEKVRYLDQVRFYQGFFGENFKVMLYEELARDPERFLADLYAFMGVGPFSPDRGRQNRGATVFTGGLYRRLNRWCERSEWVDANRRKFRRVLDFMDFRFFRHFDTRRYIGPSVRQEILHEYRESNAVLSVLISRELSSYGY